MSRYIDADFILDGIKNDRALIKDGKMDNYKEHYLAFLEKCVELTPSIEIVRCKECRYWIGETEHYEDREYKACWQLCGQYMNSEFWCKYGEREGK